MIRHHAFPQDGLARLRGLLVLGWLLIGPMLFPATTREYDVKAVFLFNFATFVDWPKDGLPAAGEPFVIGVLGADPFGAALDQTVAGEAIRGAPLQIRRSTKVEELKGCQILFISESERARLPAIFDTLRGRPVLTVGDSPMFVEKGGMIGFSTGAHVQLHVNPAAAKAAGLNISSKLLRVAKAPAGGP